MPEHIQASQELSPSPQPFEGVTLKVVDNCNMGCPECFMYAKGNQKQRTLPGAMSIEVAEQVATRLKEYVAAHNLGRISVGFHGGEPLLLGPHGISKLASTLQNMIPADIRFAIQTNGLLLNEDMAKVLTQFNFRVGISLDGSRTANDRHRVDLAGRSTYDRVVRAIGVVKAAKLEWGLLAVIDLENDPLETYNELAKHDPPAGMDFILPLLNWTTPPPTTGSPTPYGDWLIPIFDEYMKRPSPRIINKFFSIISMVLGGDTYTETLGNPPPHQVFISKGEYGDVDTLQVLGYEAPSLGMNIYDHSLDQVAEHPWMRFRRLGRQALSSTCQNCEIVDICGGGYLPHRYDKASADEEIGRYQNPSVYCHDLKKLIRHAEASIRAYMDAPGDSAM